jgi:hypothetical protein
MRTKFSFKKLFLVSLIFFIISLFPESLVIRFESGVIKIYPLFGTGMIYSGYLPAMLANLFTYGLVDLIIILLYGAIIISQRSKIKNDKEKIKFYNIYLIISAIIFFWHLSFKFTYLYLIAYFTRFPIEIIQGPGSILLLISLTFEMIGCYIAINELKRDNIRNI